ncbi:MAG: transposase [Treponema sp.]|nr:transposase [Treponema sp.]
MRHGIKRKTVPADSRVAAGTAGKCQNRALLNALIYRCENGRKWRALPRAFGKWHSHRLDRRPEKAAPERVYTAPVQEGGFSLLNLVP